MEPHELEAAMRELAEGFTFRTEPGEDTEVQARQAMADMLGVPVGNVACDMSDWPLLRFSILPEHIQISITKEPL
jgi:hypothetical protein